MTKTKSRVIQGWRQVSSRPGVAARRVLPRPPRPGSLASGAAASDDPPPADPTKPKE